MIHDFKFVARHQPNQEYATYSITFIGSNHKHDGVSWSVSNELAESWSVLELKNRIMTGFFHALHGHPNKIEALSCLSDTIFKAIFKADHEAEIKAPNVFEAIDYATNKIPYWVNNYEYYKKKFYIDSVDFTEPSPAYANGDLTEYNYDYAVANAKIDASVAASEELRMLSKQLPGISETVKLPCEHTYLYDMAGYDITLYRAIVHLNDMCGWTREQIADWIETLDVNTVFNTPTKENENV
jgi:hypothetical protein